MLDTVDALVEFREGAALSERVVQRPWGSYLTIDSGHGHKTKRVTVSPGGRLSYQRHRRRAEHWFIVAGTAEVTLEGHVFRVGPGHSVDVAPFVSHRIANPGPGSLVFVEVQTGEYCGEDDIDRLADDYGRAEPSYPRP